MIKDAYEALRKRLKNLPPFEQLDEEFEISTLENESFLLRNIKKRVSERFEEASSMLGDITHPSSESMPLMYEWRFFNAKEKKTAYHLYKKVQSILRTFDEAELMQSEEQDAKLIAESVSSWKDTRLQCVSYATRLKEAWLKEEGGKEELGYLG